MAARWQRPKAGRGWIEIDGTMKYIEMDESRHVSSSPFLRCPLLSILRKGYLQKWGTAKDTCRPSVASHTNSTSGAYAAGSRPLVLLLRRPWMIAAPKAPPFPTDAVSSLYNLDRNLQISSTASAQDSTHQLCF